MAALQRPVAVELRGARARLRAIGAGFYRDAGNPDSHEITGPVGSYFTADQELAPLADLFLGGRFVYRIREAPAAGHPD